MATAIGSCFAAATLRSKYTIPSSSSPSSSDTTFKLSFLRPQPIVRAAAAYSQSLDSLTVCVAGPKWRVSKISASVTQEEAPAVIVEEVEENVEERAEEEQESVGEEVGVESSEVPLNTKLYFGNLPYNCDSAQLAGIIQDYGAPEMVEVLYDRNTGRSRGFAFVTMSSIEDCDAVIKNLDGSQYGGRTLRVNYSDKPKAKEPLYPETEYKLFVGNLAWSVTSEILTEAFQECGTVVGARVLYDGDTGRSRGYGFVCYSTQEEMDTALERLDGVIGLDAFDLFYEKVELIDFQELEGRAMRVSVALGKRS